VYFVFAGTIVDEVGFPFNGVTLNASPLQIDFVSLKITGRGLTFTVIVNTSPGQFPTNKDFGVTV
jgi:hypothetical protein